MQKCALFLHPKFCLCLIHQTLCLLQTVQTNKALKRPKNGHKLSPDWRYKCQDIIGRLRAKKSSALFRSPVDRRLVPDYDVYIKKPMDLSTLARNLHEGKYSKPSEFA